MAKSGGKCSENWVLDVLYATLLHTSLPPPPSPPPSLESLAPPLLLPPLSLSLSLRVLLRARTDGEFATTGFVGGTERTIKHLGATPSPYNCHVFLVRTLTNAYRLPGGDVIAILLYLWDGCNLLVLMTSSQSNQAG